MDSQELTEVKFNQNAVFIHGNEFENIVCKMSFILYKYQCANMFDI